MPYHIGWYVDQHVLFWRIYGDEIPISDVEEVSALINKLTDESPAPLVHSIVEIDYTPGFKLPELAKALNYFDNPRTGWTLRYINNRVLEMWGAIVSSQKQTRFRNFHSIEECWNFLKSVDAAMPQEPLDMERIEEIRNRADILK